LLAPEIAQDKSIFPDAAALSTMVSPNALGNAARESMTAVYTEFKKGK
jgi:putrescine transport system substrate-binding protein